MFRILAHITVPLTTAEKSQLLSLFSNSSKSKDLGQLLGLLDIFSGGSLQTVSIVAFGVYSYITATIVMQSREIKNVERMQGFGAAYLARKHGTAVKAECG